LGCLGPPELKMYDDAIHLFWASAPPADAAPSFQACYALLDPAERCRHQKLRQATDRVDFVAAHALCRLALSAVCPQVGAAAWRFVRGPQGKPKVAPHLEVAARGLEFNLSHTRGMSACIVARGRAVGVDVEARDASRDAFSLAKGALAPRELSYLCKFTGQAQQREFYRLWTANEAYLRAVGCGFLTAPDKVCLQLAGDRAYVQTAAEPFDASAGQWHIRLWSGNNSYFLAAAVQGGNVPEPRIVRHAEFLQARLPLLCGLERPQPNETTLGAVAEKGVTTDGR
jgi:4'-phosphopantetheinyl transferase